MNARKSGRREIFTVVNIIFLLGSILCGISTNVTMLIACRGNFRCSSSSLIDREKERDD
jgi:MFS family permease